MFVPKLIAPTQIILQRNNLTNEQTKTNENFEQNHRKHIFRVILAILRRFEDLYWSGQPIFFGAYISDPALDENKRKRTEKRNDDKTTAKQNGAETIQNGAENDRTLRQKRATTSLKRSICNSSYQAPWGLAVRVE